MHVVLVAFSSLPRSGYIPEPKVAAQPRTLGKRLPLPKRSSGKRAIPPAPTRDCKRPSVNSHGKRIGSHGCIRPWQIAAVLLTFLFGRGPVLPRYPGWRSAAAPLR